MRAMSCLVVLVLASVASADDGDPSGSLSKFSRVVDKPGYDVRTSRVFDPDAKIQAADVDRVLRSWEVIECPNATAELVAWVVVDRGKVATVSIAGTNDRAITACLTKALKKTATAVPSKKRVVVLVELAPIAATPDGTGKAGGAGTGAGGELQADYSREVVKEPNSGGTQPKEVTIVVGPGEVESGGLTGNEIDQAMKARAGLFRACYQKELNRQPKIKGKLVFDLMINAGGDVRSVRLKSGTMKENGDVENCVRSNISRVKFPPKGPAVVIYPMTFTAS